MGMRAMAGGVGWRLEAEIPIEERCNSGVGEKEKG